MTRQNISGKPPTEFSQWLREQEDLESRTHHVNISNIDYLYQCDGKWMLVEEKRQSARLTNGQTWLFKTLHSAIKDPNYRGFHILQFESTNPEDGKVFLDGKQITKDDLLSFLRFMAPSDWYTTSFIER